MERPIYKTYSSSGKNKPNEDFVLCQSLSDNDLFVVVADGMGGLSYGADAAGIVSETILATTIEMYREHIKPEVVLRIAFEAADRAIEKRCRELRCKMGAAVTVALLVDGSLYFAWQGNVRLYKVNKDESELLTTDHAVPEADGTFLTRCVNGKGYREAIPIKQDRLEHSDKIVICTDGYYNHNCLEAIVNQEGLHISDDNLEDDASVVVISIM